MSGVLELERMVVRLIGDSSSYDTMMKKAIQDVNKTARVIDVAIRDAMSKSNRFMKEAASSVQTVTNAVQRVGTATASAVTKVASASITWTQYKEVVDQLNHNLAIGALNQEEYDRAVVAATGHMRSGTAAVAAYNAKMMEGARVTAAMRTPMEVHRDTVGQLTRLYYQGAINYQTYARGAKASADALPAHVARVRAETAAVDRAKQIYQQSLSPMQQYRNQMREIIMLHRGGFMTNSMRDSAVGALQRSMPLEGIGRAQAIFQQSLTPAQQYQQRLSEINTLSRQGYMTTGMHTSALRALNKEFALTGATIRAYGSAMTGFGRRMSMYFTLPALGVAGGGLKMFSGFEQQLAVINAAIQPTNEQLAIMDKRARSLSESLRMDPTKVLKVFTELGKAGLDIENILGGAGAAAAKFAKVGELEVSEAAILTTNSMNIFGKSAEAVGNIISSAADASSISIKNMADSFTQATATADLAGQSMEEVAAIIAIMGNHGIRGSDAGTSLRTMFLRLMAPTDKAAKIMEQYNIKTRDAEGHMLKITALADNLRDSLGNLNDQARDQAMFKIFGQDAIRAATILFKEGSAGIGTMMDKMSNARTVSEKYAIIMNTTAGRIDAMVASLQRLGIAIGEAVAGKGNSFLTWMTDTLNATTKWVSENQALTASIVKIGLIAALVLGPIVTIMGTIVTAVGGVVSVLLYLAGPVAIALGGAMQYVGGAVSLFVAQLGGVGPTAAMAFNAGIAGIVVALTALTAYFLYHASPAVQAFNAELDKRDNASRRISFRISQIDDIGKAREELKLWQGAVEKAKQVMQKDSGKVGAWLNDFTFQGKVKDFTDAKQHLEEMVAKVEQLEAAKAAMVKGPQGFLGGNEEAVEKVSKADEKMMALIEQLEHQAEALHTVNEETKIFKLLQEGANAALGDQARALAENLRMLKIADEVQQYTDRIRHMVETFKESSHEQEIFKLVQKGATDEQVAEARALAAKLTGLQEEDRLQKKVDALAEKHRSPQEKFLKEQKEIQYLYDKKKISAEAYAAEMKEIQEKFQKEIVVKFRVQGLDAVLAGSAEAAAIWDAYLAGKKVDLPVPPVAVNAANEEEIKRQAQLKFIQDQIDPPKVLKTAQELIDLDTTQERWTDEEADKWNAVWRQSKVGRGGFFGGQEDQATQALLDSGQKDDIKAQDDFLKLLEDIAENTSPKGQEVVVLQPANLGVGL